MSVLTITTENFENEVINSDVPVLVDFWASWCGPCKMMSPVVDEIADDFAGKIKVGKVNVDEQSELAEKFRIMSIPTIMLFKDGKDAAKSVGVTGKSDLADMINKEL